MMLSCFQYFSDEIHLYVLMKWLTHFIDIKQNIAEENFPTVKLRKYFDKKETKQQKNKRWG